MHWTPVLAAVKPRKRDTRSLAERVRELDRLMDEAASCRDEIVASQEGGAVVFRTRRVA